MTNNIKKTRIAGMVLAMVLAAVCIFGIGFGIKIAYAGIKQETIINSNSITGSIDQGVWYMPISNPGVEYDGGISFTESSTVNSRILVRNGIENFAEVGLDKFFTADITLAFTKLPEDVRFGFVFGKSSLTTVPVIGSANSSFVYFEERDEELYLGLSKYDASGTETEVLSAQSIDEYVTSLTASLRLNLEVNAAGGINIKINSSDVFVDLNAALPTNGYVGFGQDGGGSIVKITGVQIDAMVNTAPESSNIYEDFNSNSFNLNEFYTRAPADSTGKSYVAVKDGRLKFSNITTGFISSRRVFSNFQMTLDIPYLMRTPEFDDDWNLVTSVSAGLSIVVAASDYDSELSGAFFVNIFPGDGSRTRNATYTVITVTTRNSVGTVTEHGREYLYGDLHIWNGGTNGNQAVNLRASMQDGVFTLYVKGDGAYKKAFTYNSGSVTPGYVQVASYVQNYDERINNFEINSISIVNTDYNANIAYLARKDNSALANDYEYIDTREDDDLLTSLK